MPEHAQDEVADLLEQVASGDQQAFGVLYDRTSAKLFAVARGILGNEQLAEDCIQETYLRIWRKADTFDPSKGKPMTWLITIARYRALSMRRRKGRLVLVDSDELEPLMDATDRPNEERTQSDRLALDACLGTLEDRQTRLIRDAYLYGYTHPELAARATMPVGTVKSLLRRGLLKLKECLDGHTHS